MQIDRDGTIRFDLYNEMKRTHEIAKAAHAKAIIRNSKGCLLPEIARWIEATGGPNEAMTLIQATTLFPLAVFRAVAEHYFEAVEVRERWKGHPYRNDG